MVHIVLIALGGPHGNLQLGIDLRHLQHRISHRDHTTGSYRALGIDMRCALENLGKALHHAFGNLTMLLSAQGGQFAPTTLGIVQYQGHLVEHFLAHGCQFIDSTCTEHHLVRRIVTLTVADISRAMTSIVRDIERTLARRSRCQIIGNAIGVDTIVARRISGVLLNQFHHRL